MSQDALHTPLSEEELDRLDTLLESLPEAMNLEMLDGFYVALACGPETVPPGEALPMVLGDTQGAWATEAEAAEACGLLLRYWNGVQAALAGDDPFYDPVILEDADGQATGNDWAAGFLDGMSLGGEAWKALILDREKGDLLLPVMILAHEHDPDPQLRPDPIEADQRLEIFAALGSSLPEIYRYFEPLRRG